jgi:general secretion pathway protein D
VERFELTDVRIDEALRLLSELGGVNAVATPAAAQVQVPSLLLQGVTVQEALETVCKLYDLWYRQDGSVIRVMTAEEYQRDLTVVREPVTRVFSLLHPNPVAVAVAIRDLYGGRVRLSLGTEESDVFGNGGGGTASASISGSGSGRFSSSFGGGVSNQLAGFGGLNSTRGGVRVELDPGEQVTDRSLTAEQLARLDERGGVVAGGDLQGITRGRPEIAVTVNRRNNLLVVRTSDQDALSEIERLVVDLDRPTPQVLLEVKILEVRLGDDFQSLLDFDWVDGGNEQNLPTGKPTNPLVNGAAAVADSLLTAGNFPIAGGANLVYQYLNDHVRVRLQLLDQETRVSTLSTPLLLCANDQTARIFVGEERPLVRNFELQTTTTNGVVTNQVVPTVDLRDIGNTLRIVPRINADRSVTLTIIQDVSSVNEGGATLPVPSGDGGVTSFPIDTVTTSNLEGTVIAKDGLTLAVGGLIRKRMLDRQEGVPYLMDLPIVGWLFGSTVRAEERTELVLLITPHVLMTPAEGAARTRERMEALSMHPYHQWGDEALDRHTADQVPGHADYRLLLDDYLLPSPEPVR